MRRPVGQGIVAFIVVALAIPAVLARAAGAGHLDHTFSGDGWATTDVGGADGTDIAQGVAIQRDQRIVAAGYSGPSVLQTDVALARYKPDGSLDHSFSGDGRKTVDLANGGGNDAANAVAVDRNGRIVVVGFADTSPTTDLLLVARLRPNGSLDSTFSGDGSRTISFTNGVASGGEAVAVQRDGRIVVAGFANRPVSGGDMAVARLRPSGSLDRTFSGDGRRTITFPNGAGDSEASGVVLERHGKIVLGGYSAENGRGRDFAAARLRSNGRLDPSFSHDGRITVGFANGSNDDQGAAVAVGRRGAIAIVGSTLASGISDSDFGVVRLKRGGTLDHSFSGDGRATFGFDNGDDFDNASGVAFQRDGKLVVGGSSHQGTNGYELALARLKRNGHLDHTFSGDGRVTEELSPGGADDEADGTAIQRNRRIVLAGESTPNMTTGFDFSLARFRAG